MRSCTDYKYHLLRDYWHILQISQAKVETETAKEKAQNAYDIALEARNRSEDTVQKSSDLVKKLQLFLNAPGATPAEIRNVALDVSKFLLNL